MHRCTKILLALAVVMLFGCSKSSNSDNDGQNSQGKPGNDSEGLPGYLVNPENVTYDQSSSNESEFYFQGVPGTITGTEDERGSLYLSVWGLKELDALDGQSRAEVVLLAAARVSEDGSFTIVADIRSYTDILLQTTLGAPGTFAVSELTSGMTNTIRVKPMEMSTIPLYFSSSEYDLILYEDGTDTADSANGQNVAHSIFYGPKALVYGKEGFRRVTSNLTTWLSTSVVGEFDSAQDHLGDCRFGQFSLLVGGSGSETSSQGSGHTLSSIDGINWKSQSTNGWVADCIHDGTKYLAVGYDGMSSSENGTEWSEFLPQLEVRGRALAVSDATVVVVGEGIVSSYDGGANFSRTLDNANKFHSVVAGNGLFVARGDGQVRVSSDGFLWGGIESNAPGKGKVFFADGMFYFFSGDDLFSSADGTGWNQTAVGQTFLIAETFEGTQVGLPLSIGDRVFTSPNYSDWNPQNISSDSASLTGLLVVD